jgi:CheY-like chemotaxis protein
MSRVLLIHWNAAEATERAQKIEKLGHKARIMFNRDSETLQRVRQFPPDIFLVDLSRLPMHGREIAAYFRRQKSTRQIPILFVGGDADRVASARKLLPDAQFAEWKGIRAAIAKTLRSAPMNPVLPGTSAGYSGSPLPKKLGIREGHSVALINAPARFERKLEPLPPSVQISEDAAGANVAILFAESESVLVRDFRPLSKSLPEKTALWIAWPKQSSGIATDLKENAVREFGLAAGWVDYKVCAIDETWSGLCFARRKK